MIHNEIRAKKLANPLIDTEKLIEKFDLWDDKTGSWIKFKLWPIQKEILRVIHTYKYVIMLKKRQVGGTQLFMADTLAQSLLQQKFSTLFLSVGQAEANLALERGKTMIERSPDNARKAMGYSATNEIIRIGDTQSWVKSLTASNGRSSTAFRVGIDEAAFMTPREAHIQLQDVLKNVMPVLDQTDGQLVIISTANGIGNEYHRLFSEAVAGNNKFCAIFISCWDDPGFTQEKRLDIIEQFGQDHADQEYPRTWKEAFLSSGRPRFDRKALEEYEANVMPTLLTGEIRDGDIVEYNPKGNLRFFQQRKVHGQYLIAADVAEGLKKGDFSVAKVYDVETKEQVAEWHGHIDHAYFGTVLFWMGIHWNMAIIAPESNNHGHSSITQLRNVHHYPDNLIWSSLWTREHPDDQFTAAVRYGWITTSKSKNAIINNLAKLLVEREIFGLTSEDISELFTYVIDQKGSTNADENCYDDRVMALAIAYYIIQFIEIKTIPEYPDCGHCEHYYNEHCNITKLKRSRDYYCSQHLQINFNYKKPKNGYQNLEQRYKKLSN